MTTMTKRVFNFNAGPSVLPLEVLEKAQSEFVTFGKTGMSVMEMSHRSKDFEAILDRAEQGVRKNFGVPENYAILFLGGGASLQFSMVPMNLYSTGKPIDFIHTGSWSQKAILEAKQLAEIRLAADMEPVQFTKIPTQKELQLNEGASYVHLCSNNTIAGTEYFEFPKTGKVPLVADMSSDILSRKIDVSQFGVIFAGAQKNLGPSGVTLIIIRKDLADQANKDLPSMLQYRTHIKNRSLYNTPPTFNIYMVALVQEWIIEQGGLGSLEEKNITKAQILYDEIDRTEFYNSPIEKESRSRMNVVFRIKKGDETLETQFISEANAAGMVGLKGHRLVGGLRASIYNAHPKEGVEVLVQFMQDFEKKNG